ncbi:hypothetical protein Poli38472_002227 [Pythium oligandrum]|uniref:Orn/DAP/Arg decarboxylase 2 N-terminal domain-containing protein n=1 Tax=Pythium oligandrum TaxID=41045 RepID=A0A8K1FI04_PYTOL|nr:hypothetical protein Poli38472_002227 [Pythium oligandrum]|eukprot:TMW63286.1 hypothetical protein Poli38472_002227 [Pythium oligandrum]
MAAAAKAKSDGVTRKASPPSTPALSPSTLVANTMCDDVDREMEVTKDAGQRSASSSPSRRIALAQQVETFHPELLPLLKHYTVPEQNHHKFDLESIVDAVKLSSFLQDRLLCLPELNRNSPCYSARSIVLLYTKIRYLETFKPEEIAMYAATGDHEYEEVRLLHQLKNVASNAELYSRLATLLHIPTHGDMWNEITRFVACALPFAEQTETLLIRGSDERSVLSPITKTNKYNGSTIPFQCHIARASCTCSGMTLEGFTRCDKLRQELLLNSFSINPNSRTSTDYFDAKMTDVRTRVASCLGLEDLVEGDNMRVVLTPSGTDAELLATSAALARLFSGLELVGGKRKVTSIISAHGEIGRGSSSASGGKHFSELTPSGEPATPNEPLRRYPTDLVDVIEIPGRNADGSINRIDEEVCQTVADILEKGEGANVVLLHVVMGSKTGYICPSLEVVDRLAVKYPNRLIVVIDACQMRVERRLFREFVSKGYVVLVTGSKFFGGAPFCGAVLLPMRCVYEMETTAVEEYAELCHPLGLEDYFSRYDFPDSMKHVRQRMGPFMNVGLLLRWESALANMEPYYAIEPCQIEEICRSYVFRCKNHLRANWNSIIEILCDPVPAVLSCAKPMDTIVSFKVWDEHTQEHLDAARLRDLHTLLSKDLSSVLPDESLAKKRCLLGQPVQLGKQSGGVLRIAMGADMVNTIFHRGQREGTTEYVIEDFVRDDDLIIRKIELILEHWDKLRQQYIEEQVVSAPIELPKPLSDWNFSVKKTQIARVVRKLCMDGVLDSQPQQPISPYDDPPNKLAVVYDLDAIDMAFQALLTSFPTHFDHRFAMKSCPLSFFIRRAIENDVGVECASIVEVQHALRLGCPPHKIVFDSPCKTRRDIVFAINAGVEINADNFDELQVIREHAEELFQSNFPECTPRFAGELPRIGLRVNPLLGAGTNECLSVSTVHSKFGIPLTCANRQKIIDFFRENPWMSGLHCHVGSQGCSLEMLARGATILCDLANEIDTAAGVSRVKVINIGGGLPSNYDSDDVSPTFAEYVEVLRKCAPQLFERTGRTILTEFGRSVSSKTGWTISEVEYIKRHEADVEILGPNGGPDDLRQTAIIHAGSDLFLRTCYRPELFPHRLSVYNSLGHSSTAPMCIQNVAGPLCFGGDVIGRRVPLPQMNRGDYVVIHDSGSNTMSLFSRHCSRPAPAVYGYRVQDDELSIELLKPAESPEDVMRFWG